MAINSLGMCTEGAGVPEGELLRPVDRGEETEEEEEGEGLSTEESEGIFLIST